MVDELFGHGTLFEACEGAEDRAKVPDWQGVVGSGAPGWANACASLGRWRIVSGMRMLLSLVVLCLTVLVVGCDDAPSQCTFNSDCAAGEQCVDRTCLPQCREDRDCPTGVCSNGACLPPDGEGDATADAADPTLDARVRDSGLADAQLGDVGPADMAVDAAPRPDGQGDLTGQVHFRLYDDSILPVARPIVYWTFPNERPEPLTRGASCDCGYPVTAARGDADGRFMLRNIPAGPIWLVVQKGAFRRIVEVQVRPDVQTPLPEAVTALPVRHDPGMGLEIPQMVIGTGRFDPIEDVFAKLRLGPISPTFHFDYAVYEQDPTAWGVELMVYQQPRVLEDNGDALAAPSFLALLQDADRMVGYDFLFGPCADTNDYATALTSPVVRANLSQYVNNGGKLYSTDYSYLLVEQPFPAYVDFAAPEGANGNADGQVGDLDTMQTASDGTLRYASQNQAGPLDLRAWLNALMITAQGIVETEGNWVNVNGVGTVEQCCRDGQRVPVTPEIVMSGPNGVDSLFDDFGPSHDAWHAAEAVGANRPHTLRFPYGCGEVMYSTYHTVEDARAILSPQELVLLYLILEIGECNLDPIKE